MTIRELFKGSDRREKETGKLMLKAESINCRYELGKYKGQAEESLSRGEAGSKVDKALAIISAIPGLNKFLGDVKAVGSMVTDYVKGRYREVPYKTIVSLVAALIYVISPVDAIPDNIPGVGYIDDAAVVNYVVNSVEEDIRKYRSWKGI